MQQDIYGILVEIRSGVTDRAHIRVLFRVMFNIAREYFRRSNKNFIFNNSILPEDAAMETLTPLFLINDKPFEKLVSAFEKWKPAIKNEKDALFFLHQLVFIRSEHHLINYLRKNNSDLTSFLNYINSRIKEDCFRKQVYCGTIYLVKSQIVPGSRIISSEEFINISEKYFFDKKLLPESLFIYLQDYDFFPAVPFYLLIERYNKANNIVPDRINIPHPNERIQVQEAADEGLNYTIKKLVESYTGKNKLDSGETSAFKDALKDIRIDLTDGGISGGYYDYLKKHMPDLSHPVFKDRYENIFEYLVKTLKQEIIRVLKEQ